MSLQEQTSFAPVNSGMEFIEFWRIIMRRKWRILLLAMLTGLVGLAVSLSIAPVYRATAVVMIEANKNNVISSIEDVYAGATAGTEFYNTQAQILGSRDVAIAAIRKLKLWDQPEFDPRNAKPPVYQPVLDFLGYAKPEAPEWNEELLANAVYGRMVSDKLVSVKRVRMSQLVEVSVDSTNNELAAQIANALAEAYINNDREARFTMTQQANNWLQERLKDLRAALADSETRLQQYREREGMISLDSSRQGGATQMIAAVTQRLIDARLKAAEAKSVYDQIRTAKPAELLSLPRVMNNTVIIETSRKLQEAERGYADLSQRYGPEHPKMVQVISDRKIAREQYDNAVKLVVNGAAAENEAAQATVRSLEQSLAQAKGGVMSLNKKEFGMEVLEREVASNRQLFDMFMSRAKETNAAQDMQSSIGRVVDRAQTPDNPIKPKAALNVLIALFLGLLLGVGSVLLMALLDNTLKIGADVEAKLNQPLLTSLPKLDKAQRQNAGMILHYEPHSQYSEAIRTARTGVLLSALDAESRTLLVTSSVSGEGKTTFSSNLALAHAQTKKTLLIDADMRKPSVASKLELDPHHAGLSDLVAGQAKLQDVLQVIGQTGLHVISAGTLPPNPQELLHSKRFSETLLALQKQFDVIIIDSPPVELVSDALVLSQHCTSVVYLVRAQQTSMQLMRKGLAKLERAGAPLLGVALNYVDNKQVQDYYGYSAYDAKRAYGNNPSLIDTASKPAPELTT